MGDFPGESTRGFSFMPEDTYVAEAMIRYGGSFVRTLGQLWFLGDENNRARLKAAFPDYWVKYLQLAQLPKPDPR